MKFVELLLKKKRGEEHTAEEIKFLINGIQNKTIPDYQLSAWLMAICWRGMTFQENAILTEEIANSGHILDLSKIGEYVIDKHSTGGVGDKTTLILIPLLAAAGMPVAKLSGRGLGHTGGTIDKLESIPGFNASLTLEDFLLQVQKIGAAIAGQTSELAPADGVLYALRDVTGTVDSIPLIASSVVSKKMASGANVIVLDVKYGSGSFIKSPEQATELAERMVEIGKCLNRAISAVITSMEQPLGRAIGNSVEVIESVETLKNKGPSDLRDLCLYLGAISLVHAKKYATVEEATKVLAKHLEDGSALQKFRELIAAQGGDSKIVDDYTLLPQAKYTMEFKATEAGYLSKADAMVIAKACKLLGAGRDKKEDPIDYSVGIVMGRGIADPVEVGQTLATVYGNDEPLMVEALVMLKNAFEVSKEKVEQPALVYKTIN